MGFGFRKSIKLGGARVNLGKKGISVSTGVKGLRISTGTNGTRLTTGTGGVRYTTKLGGKKGTSNTYTQSSTCNEYAAPTILVSIVMFILGIILLYFKILSIAFYVIFISIGAGIIGYFMLSYSVKTQNESQAEDYEDAFSERKILEDEILFEIKLAGTDGILQSELIKKEYASTPSTTTIYKVLRDLEDDFKIKKEKDGRSYRIYLR